MARTVIMDHPLIQHKIGIIRKKDTSSKEFREMISEIAMLMCYEATRGTTDDQKGSTGSDPYFQEGGGNRNG